MAALFHTAVSGYPFEAPAYRYVDAGPKWATRWELGAGGEHSGRAQHDTHDWLSRGAATAPTGERIMAERIAVLGAGQMGNGIAHVFAQHGAAVTMIDVSSDALSRGLARSLATLDRQIRGSVFQRGREGRRSRTHHHPRRRWMRLAGASAGRIEAVTERRDLKFKIFEDLDRLADPAAILASNTSSISITEIGAKTKRPGQVIGMHFMANPVPVMQLVEIIRGLATSEETTQRVLALSREVGKTPVESRDYPGFIANRILMPMINEAVFCLMEGVGTAESIDTVMKLGMEPSDGAAGARGPDWPRYVPRDSRGTVRRPG